MPRPECWGHVGTRRRAGRRLRPASSRTSRVARADGRPWCSNPTLALGMARLVDPGFPADLASWHDALIGSYERRLLASPTALLDTFPGEAYPTDVAAVAAAIAVHTRVTGADHTGVHRDRDTGLVVQRMGVDGRAHDAPRTSGTGLAAYFAGFADRALLEELARGLFRQERSFLGFGLGHRFRAILRQVRVPAILVVRQRRAAGDSGGGPVRRRRRRTRSAGVRADPAGRHRPRRRGRPGVTARRARPVPR